ncbi:golgin subfamily A member 6-like protein 1 isoform X3 [Oreochromis niloticus]|uniref:golgin subfamily A member 6-like protein 1 isoform X3 n=1 Tax=Oreochromis niloticus TaxID=8128 RepID=UPI000393ED81|nr:golgin subfamily A member 6-like protein 1 isoform X3 [Oreochromis niloticus]
MMSTQKNSRDWNQSAAPQELSLAEMERKLHEANMVVKAQEEELNPVKESLAEMERKLHEANMVVKDQEEKLNSVKESLGEMEAFYRVSLKKTGFAEMEKFYKDKLQQERVAGDVDLPLKTGNSENMNNPVNETRLKEMYKELRKHWAQIKPKIKQAAQSDPEQIKAGIQRNFQCGAEEIKKKKKKIESAFNFNVDNTEASQKVQEYIKLTIQNLQLAVYYGFKNTVAQGFHGQEGETLGDSFNNLILKCRWLSSLMALNNPPLQPDWKNHDPGQDAWSFFPQEITAECATSLGQDHSENVLKYPSPFQGPDLNQTEDIMMA